MDKDREFQRLIIDYIDNEGDIDDIIERINENNLYEFIVLLGNISWVHPHFNDPEKQALRIYKLIEPFKDTIKKELSKDEEYMRNFFEDFAKKRSEILTNIHALRSMYSYYDCKFKKNTDENKKDYVFRAEYLLDIIQDLEETSLDDILDLLYDVNIEFDRIVNHKGEHQYDHEICEDDYEEWDTIINAEYDEYEWYVMYGGVIFESVYEYPDGEMNSQFDTLHDLLTALKHYLRYDNDDINLRWFDLEESTKINYYSLYLLFKKNKRVLKHLLENGLLMDVPGVFNYDLYREEIEEIIDFDDVERFVSYVTVTNYDLNKIFKTHDSYDEINYPRFYHKHSLTECAVMKGSFEIYKYLLRNKTVDPNHYLLAILGGNSEMIHYMEDNATIKFETIYYREALRVYNFHIAEYINNVFCDDVYEVCVVYTDTVKKWLLSTYMHSVLKKFNDKIVHRDRYDTIFHHIAKRSGKEFVRLLYTKYFKELDNKINFDAFPDINVYWDCTHNAQFLDNNLDRKIMKICLYSREIIWCLYENYYDFTIDIIKNDLFSTVCGMMNQTPEMLTIYKEIAYEYKDKFLEHVNYDICSVYYRN